MERKSQRHWNECARPTFAQAPSLRPSPWLCASEQQRGAQPTRLSCPADAVLALWGYSLPPVKFRANRTFFLPLGRMVREGDCPTDVQSYVIGKAGVETLAFSPREGAWSPGPVPPGLPPAKHKSETRLLPLWITGSYTRAPALRVGEGGEAARETGAAAWPTVQARDGAGHLLGLSFINKMPDTFWRAL